MLNSWFIEDKRSFLQKLCGKILSQGKLPKHVAIIMDGNRRYARKEKILQIEGHKSGFVKLSETLNWCIQMNIREVSVYAFSLENLKRSKEEISELMSLACDKFRQLLNEELKIKEQQVCIRVYGNLSVLPIELAHLMAQCMYMSRHHTRIYLNIYFAYTSRDELVHACKDIVSNKIQIQGNRQGLLSKRGGEGQEEEEEEKEGEGEGEEIKEESCDLELDDINEYLIDKCLYTSHSTSIDLLIRTSGEIRLSDYLLWQSSTLYTQLCFINKLWPQFTIWNFYLSLLNYQYITSNIKDIAIINNNHTHTYSTPDSLTKQNRISHFLNNLYTKRDRFIDYLAK